MDHQPLSTEETDGMYKPRFRGKHYDFGYRFGSLIYQRGVKPEKYFKLTHQRRQFGDECASICKNVFPEVMEEIRGLADGTRIPFRDFASFIFCMYCFEFQNWCTCFACKDKENIIFGRNSDFATSIQGQYESAFYRPLGGYSFIGNSTAMVQMEDGINEHGLAAGLTFINLKVVKPGLNAGLVLRYFLEKCRNVKEALDCLPGIPLSSAQTFILVDKRGEMAVVESNCKKTVVLRPHKSEKFMVTANQFRSADMQQYRDNVDDLKAEDRYRTAYNALKSSDKYSIGLAKDILSGKHGFMCQYDRSKGLDTVWSTIYDLRNNKVLRADGNPSRAKFQEDRRLSF
jgi:predicted choloylglycine hydrolase